MNLQMKLIFVVLINVLSLSAQQYDEFRLNDPKNQYYNELQSFNIALSFMKEGDYKKALYELKKMRSSNPLHKQVDILMGRCKLNLGEWVAAEEVGENSWYAPIDSVDLHLENDPLKAIAIADTFVKEGNFQEAIYIYSALIEKQPNSTSVVTKYRALSKRITDIQKRFISVGEDFYNRAEYRSALKEWYKALYYNPDNEILLIKIDFAEQKLGELYDFYRVRLDMLEEEDDKKEIIYFLENVFYQFPKDQFFKAKYREILVNRENYLKSMIAQGIGLFEQKKYAKAEKLFGALKKEYPEVLQVSRWHRTIIDLISSTENKPKIDKLKKSIEFSLKKEQPEKAASYLKSLKLIMPPKSILDRYQERIDEMRLARSKNKRFKNLIAKVEEQLKMACFRDAQFILDEALSIKPKDIGALHLQQKIKNASTADLSPSHDNIKEILRLLKENREKEACEITVDYTGNSILDQKVRRIKKKCRRKPVVDKNNNEEKCDELMNEGIAAYRDKNYPLALKKWSSVRKLCPFRSTVADWIENVKIKIKRSRRTDQ